MCSDCHTSHHQASAVRDYNQTKDKLPCHANLVYILSLHKVFMAMHVSARHCGELQECLHGRYPWEAQHVLTEIVTDLTVAILVVWINVHHLRWSWTVSVECQERRRGQRHEDRTGNGSEVLRATNLATSKMTFLVSQSLILNARNSIPYVFADSGQRNAVTTHTMEAHHQGVITNYLECHESSALVWLQKVELTIRGLLEAQHVGRSDVLVLIIAGHASRCLVRQQGCWPSPPGFLCVLQAQTIAKASPCVTQTSQCECTVYTI